MHRCVVVAASLALMLSAACAHMDNRTAVEHEMEAERLRSQSRKAEATVRTIETAQPVPSGSESARSAGPGLEHYAAGSASNANAKAQRHEEAARKIRQAAGFACRAVPAERRRSCPIAGEGARVEPMPRGARIVPAAAQAAEEWRAIVGCAVAEAQVDRPGDAHLCPLLAPGADARVVDRPAGAVLEIVGATDPQGEEIRRRADAAVRRETGTPAAPAPSVPPAGAPGE